MPTLTFCCGAECGIVGINAAPTVARRHWTTTGTTAPTINTVLARSPGLRCYSFSPANTTSYLSQTITGSPTTCVGRFAVRFETLPAGNAHLFSFNTAGSWCFVAFRASDNTIGVTTSTTLATFTAGPVIEAGRWYVVDVKANIVANPWLIDFRVNGTAYTQHSIAIAAGTFTTFRVGGEVTNTDKTHTAYIDDIAVSSTSGDYPIGHTGYIVGLSPNVDGTHNFSANTDFKYNDTTGFLSSATDVYTYLDDLLDNTTDFISCNAASNTEYIEVGFQNLPESVASINGMEIVSAHHASSTAANKQTLRMNDGGTTADLWADADLSNTTLTTVSAHRATAPSTSSAWTVAKVDAVLMRWNSSYGTIDVTPVPYLDAIMLEVDIIPKSSYVRFARGQRFYNPLR